MWFIVGWPIIIIIILSCRFARLLNYKTPTGGDFSANAGWLQHFFRRYGMKSKLIHGEANNYSDWLDGVLQPWMNKYSKTDIYNVDETSLYYKSLGSHTMSFPGECPTGSKLMNSKDRLNLLFCCNIDGTDKLKPVLVGKGCKTSSYENERCWIQTYWSQLPQQ